MLFELQPAMNAASTGSPETAMKKMSPAGTSANTMRGPNGITANSNTAGATKKMGAAHISGLSAAVGVSASFCSSLRASATGCSNPNGPTRFGPLRAWMRPMIRRSPYTPTNSCEGSTKITNAATNPMIGAAI